MGEFNKTKVLAMANMAWPMMVSFFCRHALRTLTLQHGAVIVLRLLKFGFRFCASPANASHALFEHHHLDVQHEIDGSVVDIASFRNARRGLSIFELLPPSALGHKIQLRLEEK